MELDKTILKHLIEKCEFLSMLNSFIMFTHTKYSKSKNLHEAFKNAGEKVLELWSAFKTFDEALKTQQKEVVKP